MRKITTLLFALCAMFAFGQKATYSIQHYSVEDGLSQGTVMSILQDKEGYMWFGTWDGLNKFDGYTFTTYKSRPNDGKALRNNRIDFLYEDSLGYIWFQTYDGQIYRLDKEYERIFSVGHVVHKLRQGVRWQFVEPRAGEMWFTADDGAICVRQTADALDPEVTLYPTSESVKFVLVDGEYNVWYNSADTLCLVDSDYQKQCLLPCLGHPDVRFYSASAATNSLYFGTQDGKVIRYRKEQQVFEQISLGVNTVVTDMQRLGDSELMVTTQSEGVFLYDNADASLRQFSSSNMLSINNDCFLSISQDKHGIVWLENEEPGIFRYRPSDKSLKHFVPPIDERYAGQLRPNLMLIDGFDGKLFVNPYGGGFTSYNYDTDELEGSIPQLTNMIHTAYVDRSGSLWLGTYDKGLDRIDIERSQFEVRDLRATNDVTGEVRAMCQRKNGDVLIAAKDGQILYFDSSLRLMEVLPIREMVYCMYEDSHGNLWLGTKGNGLIQARGKRTQLQYTYHRHLESDPYSLSCDDIYDITEDMYGNIVVATYGGGVNLFKLGRFIHSGNEWTTYPMDNASKVRNILMDEDSKTMFAATTGGLLQLEDEGKVSYFTPYYDIHSLLRDSDGNIWLGTFGGGLNKLLKGATATSEAQFEAYTTLNGMRSDIVLSLQEDSNKKLWIVSETTLSCFDRYTNAFQHFTVFSSPSDSYFTEAQAVRLQAGQMLVGCNCGYSSFFPDRIMHSDVAPNLVLTRFELFNQAVEVGSEDSPLQESISVVKEITLEHEQSVFSIEYATLDFMGANRIQYAFMLEGFDDDWNYVYGQRKATYTNLNPGTYRFLVRSTNAEGTWVNNTRSLVIHVEPSFWQTGWAVILYLLIIAGIIYICVRIFLANSKLRQEVTIEQKVTDIKLRFFTNISHELRTPLTLIAGPVENILQNEKLTPSVRAQLEIVQSNSKRMLRLINEILDFRKIQNKKMRLKIQEMKLGPLVQTTCENFTKEAYDKHIHFCVENEVPDATLWIDRDKVDIILFNLLSNAFKFTPAGKSVTVKVQEKPEYVLLTVSDTGVGMPKDKRALLFERFTSQNEIASLGTSPGTGIGLNLVKELVDLHKGYIEVDTEMGKGTSFTVLFRKGKAHFDSDVDFIAHADVEVSDETIVNKVHNLTPNEQAEIGTILIVEDSEDMRTFLANIFAKEAKVVCASDGMEGLQKAKEIVPDLIISDLMMPNMDGLEMMSKVKTDPATSHIPVILLTAKSAIESRLEALHCGADDYLTKPFSPEYLKARVENLLEQRKRLQQRYRAELLNLQPAQPQQKFPNEAFLAKLLDFMERNMDNNNLVVEDLVTEMALGRTVFFNKLKSLTGLSPVEFIRDIRIKRAAQLLEQGVYNITEVTYMVGMNDSRYFSKCFKAVYGMSPSEYKKSMAK